MRRFARKVKYAILWVAAVCLSLAVLALAVSITSYFVLLYPPVQERIVRFAEEKMSAYLLGDFTIERFESNLLSYVDIRGFRAVGKSEHRDSVYAGHVIIRYRPTALAFKRVHISSVQVKDVRGHIVMEPGNKIMVPFLPLKKLDEDYRLIPMPPREGGRRTRSYDIPKPSDWPVRIHIGRSQVDGINGVYRDLSNNMVGEIRNASAAARFHSLDSFTVHLQVPEASYRSPWWDGEIDTLGASGTITWTDLEVASMLLEGSGTRVTGGGRLSYFEDGPWDLKADFKTAIRPLPVLYTYVEGVNRDGVLEGTASYRGKLYEPLWAANVRGHGVRFRGYSVPALEVDASFGNDETGHARVRGKSEFGDFDVNASLLMEHIMEGPEFGDYSMSAILAGLNVKRITDELRVTLPVGIDDASVRLRAVGEGIAMPSAVNVSAEFGGADIAGGQVSVGADIEGDMWNLAGSWGANRFDGGGDIDLQAGTVRGRLNADIYDPSAVSLTFAKERVTGLIGAAAEIEGRFDNMSVSASVSGANVVWRGMRADSVDAFFTVVDGSPRLSKADAILVGRVDSIASYFGHDSIGGYVEAELSVVGGVEDVFVYAHVWGRELRYGRYDLDEAGGTVAFAGDTVRWNDLRLKHKSTLVRTDGRLKIGEDMETAVGAELYLDADGQAMKHAGRLSISGAVRGDSILRARCRVTAASLELLDPWIPEKHRVKGTLSLFGEFSGSTANPRARVNFQVAEPRYYGNRVFTFVGEAMLADSLVHSAALLRLSERSGAVEVMASLPFLPSSGWKLDERGNRSAFARAYAKDLNIRSVTGFLEPDFQIAGTASFDARMTKTSDNWELDGTLTLPDGSVRYAPHKIDARNVALSARASGTLEEPLLSYTLTSGAVIMEPFRIEKSVIKGRSVRDTLFVDESRFTFQENSRVDANGMMLYSGMDSLLYGRNFYIQYVMKNFPSSFFAHFWPEYNLRKGLINGSGVVYADDGRPLVDGNLYLSRLELEIPDISPMIGPISAHVKLDGGSAEVVTADAVWGRGLIHADGRLTWDTDSVYDINLNLRASELAFELPEVVNVGIQNADLQIFDRNGSINVRGQMALAPTSYVRDVSIVSVINQMQAGPAAPKAADPFLQKVRLRVGLDLANNMNVNINLGTVFLDGRLTISGTAAEPGIVGQVKVTDGFVYYLDRKFDITEGTLFNPDQTTVNPTLNIIAKSDVVTQTPGARAETFTITLTLLGTLETPVVRLTSEPALSELDIFSVLTFGERMGGLGSDINDRLMNIAAHQALGLGARRLERMLNLDRVSVSGDLMGAGGGTLGLTKRFSSRLNLTYETNMGNLSDRKVTAQYRLLPNLFLEGQTTGDGDNAVDFIFRYSR